MTEAHSIRDRLHIDGERTVKTIEEQLRSQVAGVLKRRGVVVAMSGGVDSSVCAGLAVGAFGVGRVLGLLMPEREGNPEDLDLAKSYAAQLGIEAVVEDITLILETAGCYRRRDETIRSLVPEYGAGWRCKLGLGGSTAASDRLNITYLTVQSPQGETQRLRLSSTAYREIVAATDFKQRVRKMVEYYHADRLHYAVLGTPNRLEYDQGFFVKGGDGLADVKPIAHLYKSQVYQLADYLGVPEAIRRRVPTTGTFPLEQTQEEFFFSLPLVQLDLALFGHDHGIPAARVAAELGITEEQTQHVYRDIEQKRSTTRYLHAEPLLVEPVAAVG